MLIDVLLGKSIAAYILHLFDVSDSGFIRNLGAFGNVRYGWLKKQPKKKYAIKTMKKAEIIQSKHVDHIENEKNILARIQHPFAVSNSNLDRFNFFIIKICCANSLTIPVSSKTVALSTLQRNYCVVVTYSLITEPVAISAQKTPRK